MQGEQLTSASTELGGKKNKIAAKCRQLDIQDQNLLKSWNMLEIFFS